MEKFTKQCPLCGKEQKYGMKKVYLRALREKWECRKCAVAKSSKHIDRAYFQTEEYKRKMSESLKINGRILCL